MAVEFDTTNVNDLLAEMEKEETAGQFVSKYWSPKNEGVTKIRFIPQLKTFGEKLFYQKHMIHYNIGGKPYFCLKQTLTDKNGNLHEAEECPICKKASAFYEAANKDRDSIEWKKGGELRAKERFVSRIVVRGKKDKDGNDEEAKPEFYQFGQKIRDMIKSALSSGEYGNPTDLKAGRDFNLSKKGQKKNTDYSGSMFSGSSTPIFTDPIKLKTLLGALGDMDYSQLVEFESADSLKRILKECLSEDTEDDSVTVSVPSPADDPLDTASIMSAPAEKKEEATGDSAIDDILAEMGDL